GGSIYAASAPGNGSTFTVTVGAGSLVGVKLLHDLTEAELDAKQIEHEPSRSRIELSCRVLLAEDGADNQRLISFVLKRAGAKVATADNGQMAVDLALTARAEGEPFDVILMDMQMPVMDGYEATGKLREAEYTGPIIALTAHAMSTDRDKCLAAGCDDYMAKPIDRKKLIESVHRFSPQAPTENVVATK
ncbi:MAG: response regulator, partial [Planctomycetota bacterium]|nr:response regulator [Planctomycetota bacterium]